MDIKKGTKGDLVLKLQKKLIELDLKPGPLDGDFGPKTEKALIKYQKIHQLKADGIMGPITAAALNLGHLFQVPEIERRQMKSLLANNPNYFGTFPDSGFDAVSNISGNIKYEELSCVGFNPDRNLVSATFQLKLPYGYGGNQCGNGSMEHVRFYLDYGNGDGWEDLGLGGVRVWDIPNADDCANKPNKPLTYTVSIEIDPTKKFCVTPVLPKLRAILSWEFVPPPDEPDWPPPWGNVMDRHIQIQPKPWLSFIPIEYVKFEYLDILDKYKLKEVPELIPIDIPGPPPVTFKELATLYTSSEFIQKSGTKVEPSRFGHSSLKMISETAVSNELLNAGVHADWAEMQLDLGKYLALLEKTAANVDYEELYCLGLDPNRDWLEATFSIKKTAGYSGGLCKPGSKEYIAFWADWDNSCNWVYLDTVEVQVHDILQLPADGLSYTAFLKVDLDNLREKCSIPKIARIRAVLSWNQPPSTTDPNDLRHYGNRIDTHVQIKPAVAKELLYRIGGVQTDQIDHTLSGKTLSNAQIMPGGALADYWGSGTNACPFGGSMFIVGKLYSSGKYRLHVRPAGDASSEQILRSKFWISKASALPILITPDPVTGFVDYSLIDGNNDDMLGTWASGSNQGLWEIRLERVQPDNTVVYSPWYKVLLDNTEATAEITLDSGACHSFVKGTVAKITGKYVATDTHFAGFRIYTTPTSINPPAVSTPGVASTSAGSVTTSRVEVTSADNRSWELEVDEMATCGYVMVIHAFDQTIRSNHSNAHTYARDDVGFCLIEG